MSGEDKNLRETIRDAMAETKEPANAQPAEETKEELSQDSSLETNSGETKEKEYVSGIDISDVPEQDRPKIREYLGKKAKLLEDGYQGKFKEVAELKKAQKDLENLGLTPQEARDVLMKHIEQKRNPKSTSEQRKEAVKELDRLLDTAPYEQRATLEQMRRIILEETDVGSLKKEIDDLKELVGRLAGVSTQSRRKELSQEIDSLTEKYGKDLIDKYRDVILEKGVVHPNITARKILYYEAPEDEIEEAILAQKSKNKKPLTEEKKNAISSAGSNITSAKETIDIKKVSLKDIIMSGMKK